MSITWQEVNRLNVLSPEGVEAIRGAALRVLEQVGVQIIDPEVGEMLHGAGAHMEGDRVRLPERLVVDGLAKAPREVTLYDRNGGAISSEDGIPYHGPAPSAVAVLEYDGGRHTSTYGDVADLTRLADGLPGIDLISPPAIAQDCSASHSGLLTAEAVFCNTDKFCLAFALNRGEAEGWVAMAELAEDNLAEQPTIGFAISPTSPLVLARETSDILVYVARRGLPIVTVPGGMAGATSPYTIAGTLVVEHAEALLVVTIAQIVRPGTPCILGLASAIMDMASGNISLGMPERTLLLNAVAPLARAWGLPGYAPAGLSDSFELDEQAGAEKMLSFVTSLASGLEFSSGVGRMEGGLAVSYEGIVIDHELLQMARRYLRGIQVDRGTLAEEVIARVGPGGSFLTQPHTRAFLRSGEFQLSRLFNRRACGAGGRAVREAAHDQVSRILAEHPAPVPEEQQKAFRAAIVELLPG
jgi:trimethylamine--corrinoid protein Co-methyltransferase